jgi:hypothetical protein
VAHRLREDEECSHDDDGHRIKTGVPLGGEERANGMQS